MSETLAPQHQEGLSPEDQEAALFWRNQQRGMAHNMETTGIRQAAAEETGKLDVVRYDKVIDMEKGELAHAEDQAKRHYEANAEAYEETARREAEAAGHRINR